MENFISTKKEMHCNISAIIIWVMLNTYSSVALPMWIWTEGCIKVVNISNMTITTLTNNLPSTCFRACGEFNSTRIALQGNNCTCHVDKYNVTSVCRTPCEQNVLLECGDRTEGYWSMYRKASEDELASQYIPGNASGCVIHQNNSFKVINCNRTKLHGLCKNLFTKVPRCSVGLFERWSTRACTNVYDRLISEFNVTRSMLTYTCLHSKTWIGLFAFEEESDLDSSPISVKKLTVSHASALNPPRTESEHSLSVTPSKTIINTPSLKSNSSNITMLSTTLISSINTFSSVAAASVTEYSLGNTYLSLKSSHLLSSFASVPPVQRDYFLTIFTTPLSITPTLSQPITYSKHSRSPTSSVKAQAILKIEDKSAVFSLTVSTTSKDQFMSTSLPTTVRSQNNLYIDETSLARSDVSSQIDRFTTESSTTEPVTTTKSTRNIKELPVVASDAKEEKSERTTTDLLIAVSVTGAIALFVIVIVAIMIVYVKRLSKMVKSLNITTFTGNQASYQVGEDLSRSSFCNVRAGDTSSEGASNDATCFGQADDRRGETSSDHCDVTFCRRGTRANLNDRPSFLNNLRSTIE